jgi:hypothetical protein
MIISGMKKTKRSRLELTIHGPKSRSRNLRYDNPAARSPTKLEEGREEKDASQGEVTDRGNAGPRDGRVKADIETDHKHGAALGYRCPKEGASSSQRIGCKK